ETDDDPSGWAERERGRTHALQRFITTLAGDLANPPSSWSGLARWTHELVARWIGSEAARVHWSDFEQEAARRVDAAVDRLGGLDDVESAPTLDVFRRSLALELDAARDRVGRLGEGVLVGSAPLALGVELDRLWVCGLAEGVFPAPPADDPLLADAAQAERWFTLVPSYVYGLAHAAFPPTRHELDVRAALARDPRLAEVPEVARGVALVNARRGPAFTRFDGNLAHRTDVLAARSP